MVWAPPEPEFVEHVAKQILVVRIFEYLLELRAINDNCALVALPNSLRMLHPAMPF